MSDWIKYGMQGWTGAFFMYYFGGNSMLKILGQEGIGFSFRLFAATLVFGFIPGILTKRFINKKWSAYVGGSILSIIFLTVILVMSI